MNMNMLTSPIITTIGGTHGRDVRSRRTRLALVALAVGVTSFLPLVGSVDASGRGTVTCPAYTEPVGDTLRVCHVGPEVVRLQRALDRAGHDIRVDGYFGPRTLAAVEEFQRANRLAVDGTVGPLTRLALGIPTAAQAVTPAPKPSAGKPVCPAYQPAVYVPLSLCNSGTLVRDVQEALTERGFRTKADGYYGPATTKPVRQFQQARGLPVDGVVGVETFEALDLYEAGL